MKSFLLYLFLSVITHGLLFVDSRVLLIESQKSHFAKKNLGKTSIKIRLAADKSLQKKSKSSIKSSQKTRKIEKKLTKEKRLVDAASRSVVDSGEKEELNNYLDKIRNLIAKRKVKSRLANRLKLTGSVKISFLIIRPGSIKNIRVIKSSDHKNLDNSALNSIQNIGKIPVVPSSIPMKEIPVSLEILYE